MSVTGGEFKCWLCNNRYNSSALLLSHQLTRGHQKPKTESSRPSRQHSKKSGTDSNVDSHSGTDSDSSSRRRAKRAAAPPTTTAPKKQRIARTLASPGSSEATSTPSSSKASSSKAGSKSTPSKPAPTKRTSRAADASHSPSHTHRSPASQRAPPPSPSAASSPPFSSFSAPSTLSSEFNEAATASYHYELGLLMSHGINISHISFSIADVLMEQTLRDSCSDVSWFIRCFGSKIQRSLVESQPGTKRLKFFITPSFWTRLRTLLLRLGGSSFDDYIVTSFPIIQAFFQLTQPLSKLPILPPPNSSCRIDPQAPLIWAYPKFFLTLSLPLIPT